MLYYFIILLSLFSFTPIFTEENSISKNQDIEENTVIINGKVLSISQAMEYAIFNNLNLKEAFIDFLQTDTDLLVYKKKYATMFNINGSFSTSPSLPTSQISQAIQGNRTLGYNVGASVSQNFITGTQISLGITNPYVSTINSGLKTLGIAPIPDFYKPTLYLSLQQEFLKNFFGTNDRKQIKAYKLKTEIAQEQMVDQFSALLVNIITSYWQVTIANNNVKNMEGLQKNAEFLLNMIKRNYQNGLGEKYDVDQYTALVASVIAKVKLSQFQLNEATRNLIRQINLPSDSDVNNAATLKGILPVLDKEKSLDQAYNLRIDYKNAKRLIEYSQLQKDIAFNNLLPSLTVNAQLTLRGQDSSYTTGLSQVYSFTNPDFSTTAQMSYPLFDSELKAKARNAASEIEQSQIALQRIKIEIRDKVISSIEEIQLKYDVYNQNKLTRLKYTDYYQHLLERVRQGKATALQLKLSLDSMVNSQQAEIDSLVQYNVAVLNFHLVKGDLFLHYGIDVYGLINKFTNYSKK